MAGRRRRYSWRFVLTDDPGTVDRGSFASGRRRTGVDGQRTALRVKATLVPDEQMGVVGVVGPAGSVAGVDAGDDQERCQRSDLLKRAICLLGASSDADCRWVSCRWVSGRSRQGLLVTGRAKGQVLFAGDDSGAGSAAGDGRICYLLASRTMSYRSKSQVSRCRRSGDG
ncbi:hypothetical protein ACLOJK_028309, partial [Asimina triloba]